MKPLVTIIIPMYNCEKTIITALDSIPKRKDIELLLVDDCSTDDTFLTSCEWLDDHDTEFNQVHLYSTQSNVGCGGAKNLGYELANGTYIWSLDSDDYYLTDATNNFLDSVADNKYEDVDIIFIDNETNGPSIWTGERPAAWAYLIRKDFLGGMRCPLQRRGADWKLFEEIKTKTPRVTYTSYCCYHYNYMQEGSTTWKYSVGLTDSYGNPIDPKLN